SHHVRDIKLELFVFSVHWISRVHAQHNVHVARQVHLSWTETEDSIMLRIYPNQQNSSHGIPELK
ncbi:adenomatous polyposis coli protein, partial [Biomphalaria glabrata]